MNKRTANIYIELDALLDTRYNVLNTLNPELAGKLLEDGTYLSRTIDKFAGFDEDDYWPEYAGRTADTITESKMTMMIMVIKDFIDKHIAETITHPFYEGVMVSLITDPYDFNDLEKETLLRAIGEWFPGINGIEIYEPGWEGLTTTFCSDNVTALFVYNLMDWLKIQEETFKAKPIPLVECYAPALLHEELDQETIEFLTAESTDPFSMSERTIAPMLGVKLIKAAYFSLITPDNMRMCGITK